MTVRQKLLQMIYPLLVRVSSKKKIIIKNINNKKPVTDFHGQKMTLIDGSILNLDTLKGKKVLIVNTASDCGYTAQYDELQKLYEQYKDQLEIIAIPSNDFKDQEKGSETEILNFCRKNYGVTFLIAKKASVLKTQHQHKIFKWLSYEMENGWNNKPPVWNFSKYLVNEDGVLTHFFGPAVSPLNDDVINAIKN